MKDMSLVSYILRNPRLRQFVADFKLFLHLYKYQVAEQGDAIVLKPGKRGILGGFIAAEEIGERHHKIFGSSEGYSDVVICFGDFRRGLKEPKKYGRLPHLLQEFELDGNSQDISDLCSMSKHCAEGEASDRELTQLIRLAKRYDGKLRKVWDCGERCTLNYSASN